jgi:ribose transport system permease protein
LDNKPRKPFSWARILNFAPQLLLLVIIAVAAVVDPRIIAPANLVDVLVQATPIALVALGAMVVLVSGGIDFSPAYGVSMCAVLIGASSWQADRCSRRWLGGSAAAWCWVSSTDW